MKNFLTGRLPLPSATPGIILVVIALALPLYWFVGLGFEFKPQAVYSQYLGAYAIISMAITQLLATRLNWLESLFGGIDRIYVYHKWLAISAVASLMLHENISAEVRGGFGTSLSDVAEDIGDFGYKGVLILSVLSIMTFIPYHMWKWTHKLMGFFFMLGVFHFIYIDKALRTFEPVGLYILFFCVLGVACYIYTLLFRDRMNSLNYKIQNIANKDDITEITLEPVGRKLRAKPGQFAFLHLKTKRLKEAHPFTISDSVGEDGRVRFSIKSLGSYTAMLKDNLNVGEPVSISGPYGRFNLENDPKPKIWIAGGIGITPFLAFTKDPNFDKMGKIQLYYCVRSNGEAPYYQELKKTAEQYENFELKVLDSNKGQRLSASQILGEQDEPISDKSVYFCGPEKMRMEIWKNMRLAGLKRKNFKYEKFEFRTGIGFIKLFVWIRNFSLKRLSSQKQPSGAN